MRPKGEICHAMVKAWSQGPATVTQAARLACVGVGAARYTASRMVSRGELVVVNDSRPAVLGMPGDTKPSGPDTEGGMSHYFSMLSMRRQLEEGL